MVSYQQFTSDLPEFANQTTFPQSSFNFAANFASLMLTPVWGQPAAPGQPNTLYDIGCELFIAHNMVLSAMNTQSGGLPGLTRGIVAGTSGGPLSVTYDTVAGIVKDAGHWNLTTYGIRFIQMAELLGAAPTQVSPSGCLPPNSGPPWTGPLTIPGWFGN